MCDDRSSSRAVRAVRTQENVAYRAVSSSSERETSIPFKPLNDVDAIYDDPLVQTDSSTEKESLYENTVHNSYEYNYI